MKWQKWFPIKGVFLSENDFRNVLTFSQWNGKNGFRVNAFIFPKRFVQSALTYEKNVLKRLANQHRLQETLSIGLEIERNMFEIILKPVFLIK